MAEGFINQTEGSGKKSHTWNRTIGANSIEDEFVLPGEYPYATYGITTAAVSFATSADHVLQIMAGGTLPVRLRRVIIAQSVLVTAAAELTIICLRLTTAGTGGTVVTPRPFDSADGAAGCTAMTIPTAKGTEGVELWRRRTWLVQTAPTQGIAGGIQIAWEQLPNEKPIIIPAGTANGIAFKIATGRAGAQGDVMAEVVETNFV
jgi:hypothetical protein